MKYTIPATIPIFPTTMMITMTTCQSCQAAFAYEPIFCFDRDLAAHLKKECPRCLEKAERKRRNEMEEDRMQQMYQMLRTTLPPDLRETDEGHPLFNRPLWAAVGRWHPSAEHRTLGMVGPAARGKTRVLALLARREISQGRRVVWTTAIRLKDAAHDRISRDREISAPARELLRDCMSAPWLFLDDLGKNEWTSTFESVLFQILDHRLNHHLPTAWTSNLRPEDLLEYISPANGSPIIGRLLDRCLLVDLAG